MSGAWSRAATRALRELSSRSVVASSVRSVGRSAGSEAAGATTQRQRLFSAAHGMPAPPGAGGAGSRTTRGPVRIWETAAQRRALLSTAPALCRVLVRLTDGTLVYSADDDGT